LMSGSQQCANLVSYVSVKSHRLSFSWSKTQVRNLTIPRIHFLGIFFCFQPRSDLLDDENPRFSRN